MSIKYYAVKTGKIPGIYQTWDEAKKQVLGFSGAKYKSFSTLEEAEGFMLTSNEEIDDCKKEETSSTNINDEIEKRIASLSCNEVIAFVDGSYSQEAERAGFGTIIISEGGEKTFSYNSFGKQYSEEFLSLRNVAAELEGVKEALEVAVNSSKSKITIYYDYEGIEMWATKKWKAKTKLTQNYITYMQEKMKYIDIEFVKVTAHSGIIYNEEADALAKKSLLSKGHKTYRDGSVYFVGYTVNDWNMIIDCINDENNDSLDNQNEAIKIEKKDIGDTRKQLIITNSKNKVSINLYNNSTSYVQGKQSVLFQKIIATAIEFLTNDQSVVETLNSYHALTISKEEVEVRFGELLPNYNDDYNSNNYHNLLSAIYNTMLTGYMPDYTCLVTPIFRAYEHYLHKILGEKMGLQTACGNGANCFSFFNKNSSGAYECNSASKEKLSNTQLDFLNEFYTNYNRVRHPYSHWSADDYDTAMIDNINQARNLLLKGLKLIDDYYKLF